MPDSPAVLAEYARNYPFPIAFALREAVLDAPDDERRVRGIVQTFTLGIQYAALVRAGEYARADYKDEQLSWGLESLKRPLVSHFANFVRAALRSLRQNGVAPSWPTSAPGWTARRSRCPSWWTARCARTRCRWRRRWKSYATRWPTAPSTPTGRASSAATCRT